MFHSFAGKHISLFLSLPGKQNDVSDETFARQMGAAQALLDLANCRLLYHIRMDDGVENDLLRNLPIVYTKSVLATVEGGDRHVRNQKCK